MASSSSTDVGFNLGGGLMFGVAGRKAYTELRYHRVMMEGGARFVPSTLGITF